METEENKTCVACPHVHENADGTCGECDCQVGKKEESSEGAEESSEML